MRKKAIVNLTIPQFVKKKMLFDWCLKVYFIKSYHLFNPESSWKPGIFFLH